MPGEHAILWGSLRCQRDRLIVVCGAEASIAMTEGVLKRIVQHGCSHVEEGLHRRPAPAHLLLLDEALGEELIDRRLDESGGDPLAASISLAIVLQLLENLRAADGVCAR